MNDLNLSIAELGAICNCLQENGSRFAYPDEIQNIVKNICEYVKQTICDEFYQMWLIEFQIKV